LIKIEGSLKSTNQLGVGAQRSLGFTSQGVAMFQAVVPNSDWSGAWNAIGGHPNLVTNGQIDVWPASSSSFYTSKHPRTAVGITEANTLLLVTVDGRTPAGKGMTINELANYMVLLGATQAINLDGGGSTLMWVKNKSINGIVNFPSDNQKADHYGERAVSDALFIYNSD
jgi:exopolysaccharide biosynthesis protein